MRCSALQVATVPFPARERSSNDENKGVLELLIPALSSRARRTEKVGATDDRQTSGRQRQVCHRATSFSAVSQFQLVETLSSVLNRVSSCQLLVGVSIFPRKCLQPEKEATFSSFEPAKCCNGNVGAQSCAYRKPALHRARGAFGDGTERRRSTDRNACSARR